VWYWGFGVFDSKFADIALCEQYGDGNFGDYYQCDDAELLAMW
jgi:hypothetical protein